MSLGTKVDLGQGHIVLHEDPAPPPKKGTAPNFRPCLLWPGSCPSQLLLSSCCRLASLSRIPHRSRLLYVTIVSPAKTAEPIESAVWDVDSAGTNMGAHWRNLVNTIEPSLCGGDAVLCQISLTTCVVIQMIKLEIKKTFNRNRFQRYSVAQFWGHRAYAPLDKILTERKFRSHVQRTY